MSILFSSNKTFSSLVDQNLSNFPPLHDHFAANVDFNGDCFADLILVSESTLGQQYM